MATDTGRAEQPRGDIVLGGRVHEQVCAFVGADAWATGAMGGVQIGRQSGRQRG